MPKTKAETSFDRKLSHLLGEGRRKPDPGPVMVTDEAAAKRFNREQSRPLPPDTEAVAKVFGQFGTYLELVGQDGPVGEARTFEWPAPATKALVHVPNIFDADDQPA